MKIKLLDGVFDWLGGTALESAGRSGHDHGNDSTHGHSHGVIDATIATTERGIWALKWSFAILALTAAMQVIIVLATGSVALLADTIHNFSDAGTAIPLWVAFKLAQRKPTPTFTYGYGRFEDLAGVAIVVMILISALVAGYVSIQRLIAPEPITLIKWVALAGVIGFIGNEAVAILRIRVGREINSAALIADGYHARTDGLTSLAVVAGAIGVWLGFPLADPIIGLLITFAIFGIVWQSGKAVLTRMLDGVDPGIIVEMRAVAEAVPGLVRILDIKARWLGHQLHADVVAQVGEGHAMSAANQIGAAAQKELLARIPSLSVANIRLTDAASMDAEAAHTSTRGHHHAPAPFKFESALASGVLEIVETSGGERLRLTLDRPAGELQASVSIDRAGNNSELLPLVRSGLSGAVYESENAPAEPHEFSARLDLTTSEKKLMLRFQMSEPHGHRH